MLTASTIGIILSGVVLAQYLSRTVQQVFARLGQDHAPRRPNEELRVRLILELANLHADGRLRNMNSKGGGSEGAGLGNRDKSSQLTYFHLVLSLSGIVIVFIKSFSFHYTQ